MFFVTYFIQARNFVVIPAKWLKDSGIIMEKCVNYSINTIQTHRCFYSVNIAENGETNQQPNFHARIENEIPLNGECCFYGCIVKFFSEY